MTSFSMPYGDTAGGNGLFSAHPCEKNGTVSKRKHKKEESESYTFPLSWGLGQGAFRLIIRLSINLLMITLTHFEMSLIEFPRTGAVGEDRLHVAYVAQCGIAHWTLVTFFSGGFGHFSCKASVLCHFKLSLFSSFSMPFRRFQI